jgi:uncharacterized protein YbjT (DUF2867 family)
MDLLILGGTGFLGRHLVESALGDGHRPTLFNRGLTEAELFPEVEKIEGDREGDPSALRGRRWDAVIDTCGYVPRVVGASARLLADAVDHYTFVSSISVYSDDIASGADEGAPVRELPDPTVEEVTGETYGGLKALCERAAEETMPGRVLNIRPGLISGPHDPTDRFTYWPRRIAAGGEVLAPDREERKVQYIDVRDLASWIVEMSEQERITLRAPTTSYGWADCWKGAKLSAVPARSLSGYPRTSWRRRESSRSRSCHCGCRESTPPYRPLIATRLSRRGSPSGPCPRRSRTCWIGTALRRREESPLPASPQRGSRSCSGPGTMSACRMRVAR